MPDTPQERRRKLLLAALLFLGLDHEDVVPEDRRVVIRDLIIAALGGLATADVIESITQEITAAGVTERWVLGSGGDSGKNCPICVGFSEMGDMPLGFFPAQRAQTTYCQEHCTCGMAYSDGQDHPEIRRIDDWQEWEQQTGYSTT